MLCCSSTILHYSKYCRCRCRNNLHRQRKEQLRHPCNSNNHHYIHNSYNLRTHLYKYSSIYLCHHSNIHIPNRRSNHIRNRRITLLYISSPGCPCIHCNVPRRSRSKCHLQNSIRNHTNRILLPRRWSRTQSLLLQVPGNSRSSNWDCHQFIRFLRELRVRLVAVVCRPSKWNRLQFIRFLRELRVWVRCRPSKWGVVWQE